MDRFVVLLLAFLCIQTIKFSFCSIESEVVCITRERQALLSFKQGLNDPNHLLSSWTDEDCCRWKGVGCNNRTGHVQILDLSPGEFVSYKNSVLGGKISPSLFELKHLKYLDLSIKDFGGIPIPKFLGSLDSLRYLNLSNAGFGGMVPHQLGNLSSLRYLDLSGNSLSSSYGGVGLHVESFQWLSHLSFLKHLDMSGVNLGKASDYLQIMNMLPSLSELHLSSCSLDDNIALPIPYVNFTSLSVIDLSQNNFNSSVPNWLFGISDLVSIDLSLNYFQGPIPDALQNMTSLRALDLSWNNFNSTIPDWLYNLSSLESLGLRNNILQGTISSAVGNLTFLSTLYLSSNELEGGIPTTLGNLCNLLELDLSANKLSGDINGFLGSSSGCIVNSSLEVLDLRDNRLSGHLPYQLGQLKSLYGLFLGINSFSGTIPASLGRLTSLRFLHVAYNQLNGTIPESLGRLSKLERLLISDNSLEGVVSEVHFANLTKLKALYASSNSLVLKVHSDWIPPFQLEDILLGSWQLGPQFPAWLRTQKNFSKLELSSTGISDKIPTWFWNLSSRFSYLNLSQNQIHGEIPRLFKLDAFYPMIFLGSNLFKGPLPLFSSNVGELDLSNNSFSGPVSHFLCQQMDEPSNMKILDLSYNLLSGKLPNCWTNWPYLEVVKLGNNNFTGNIPSSMGSLSGLQSLHLRKNSLSGKLPQSLRNCTELKIIDLGKNEFSGSIPTWMGKNLSKLMVLGVRSNNFRGSIPSQLCDLTSLQILDLAHNNLSGAIPQCFSNFTAMATEQTSSGPLSHVSFNGDFVEKALLVLKGQELEYSNTLTLLMSMDLSVNNFSGEIPKELTRLSGLRALNLSRNHLTGKIPGKIGDMRLLESLDLSKNELAGVVPQGLSNLTFLNNLNLSYNRLSGRIPSSTQLQSFYTSSFIGNRELCGPPLTKGCTEDNTSKGPMPGNIDGGDNDSHEFEMVWFFSSMALGFVLGFWCIWGPLLFNKSLRFSYFQLLGDMKDKIFGQ